MSNIFRNKNDDSSKNEAFRVDPLGLQKAYCTANGQEKTALLTRYSQEQRGDDKGLRGQKTLHSDPCS